MAIARTLPTFYFTIPELESAFQLVTDAPTANRMAYVWSRIFASDIVGDRVVNLAPGFNVPRLGPETIITADLQELDRDFESAAGSLFLRFSDFTITILAGSNREIRARFEAFGIELATGTLDDGPNWQKWLAITSEIAARN